MAQIHLPTLPQPPLPTAPAPTQQLQPGVEQQAPRPQAAPLQRLAETPAELPHARADDFKAGAGINALAAQPGLPPASLRALEQPRMREAADLLDVDALLEPPSGPQLDQYLQQLQRWHADPFGTPLAAPGSQAPALLRTLLGLGLALPNLSLPAAQRQAVLQMVQAAIQELLRQMAPPLPRATARQLQQASARADADWVALQRRLASVLEGTPYPAFTPLVLSRILDGSGPGLQPQRRQAFLADPGLIPLLGRLLRQSGELGRQTILNPLRLAMERGALPLQQLAPLVQHVLPACLAAPPLTAQRSPSPASGAAWARSLLDAATKALAKEAPAAAQALHAHGLQAIDQAQQTARQRAAAQAAYAEHLSRAAGVPAPVRQLLQALLDPALATAQRQALVEQLAAFTGHAPQLDDMRTFQYDPTFSARACDTMYMLHALASPTPQQLNAMVARLMLQLMQENIAAQLQTAATVRTLQRPAPQTPTQPLPTEVAAIA